MAGSRRVARFDSGDRRLDETFEKSFDAFDEPIVFDGHRRLARQGTQQQRALFRKGQHHRIHRAAVHAQRRVAFAIDQLHDADDLVVRPHVLDRVLDLGPAVDGLMHARFQGREFSTSASTVHQQVIHGVTSTGTIPFRPVFIHKSCGFLALLDLRCVSPRRINLFEKSTGHRLRFLKKMTPLATY
jgi:hypothetical protein